MKLNAGHVLLAMLLLAAGAWLWSSFRPGAVATAPAGAKTPASSTIVADPACPMPPRVAAGQAPLQTDAPSSLPAFARDGYALKPLAGFSVDARVLSREDYRLGREAELSPVDLALGWQGMADEAVLSRLAIRQSGRWYHYRWEDQPPLPPREIAHSSANMHMIPASESIARALAAVRKHERVRIDGWLVQVDSTRDGWHWRSSLTRTDTGGGACEVVYVCAVERR